MTPIKKAPGEIAGALVEFKLGLIKRMAGTAKHIADFVLD